MENYIYPSVWLIFEISGQKEEETDAIMGFYFH